MRKVDERKYERKMGKDKKEKFPGYVIAVTCTV
jgi:hypothetical protein